MLTRSDDYSLLCCVRGVARWFRRINGLTGVVSSFRLPPSREPDYSADYLRGLSPLIFMKTRTDRVSVRLIERTLTSTHRIPDLRFRNGNTGEEAELLRGFLLDLRVPVRCGEGVCAFVEPSIGHAFPDAVLVTLRDDVASQPTSHWLGKHDLRTAQILLTLGGATLERLLQLVGNAVHGSLTRLEEAGFARLRRGEWRLRALSKLFPVRRIVAIEAKLTPCVRVLEQASANRWFADEVYALLPEIPRSRTFLETAKNWGVGIWVAGQSRPVLKSASIVDRQPLSYASWLLSGWATLASSQ
jgi:hypothetical protein